MFDDYQAAVLAAYHEKKKKANGLRHNLLHPTTVRLQKECAWVFTNRYLKKDEPVLDPFVDKKEDKLAYLKAINDCDTDKFRPLVNYLKGKTKDTDEKNIKLLAWLIDYEPRPYTDFWEDVKGPEPDIEINPTETAITATVTPDTLPIANVQKADVKEPDRPSPIPVFKKWMVFAAAGLILVVCGGLYVVRMGMGQEDGCMYWAGDHYKATPCNVKLENTTILALDTIRLVHFKKIMETDTITLASIGRVWYSKIDNKVEFYTSDGYHPIHDEKHLRPVTAYIIKQHIHPKPPPVSIAKK